MHAVEPYGGAAAVHVEDDDRTLAVSLASDPDPAIDESAPATALVHRAAPSYAVPALLAAQSEPPIAPAGVPPGRVRIAPDATAAAIADDWYRAGKAAIGMGDPEVYDAYMARHAFALNTFASAFEPAPLGIDTLRGIAATGAGPMIEVRTLVPAAAALADQLAGSPVGMSLVLAEHELGHVPLTRFAIQLDGAPAVLAAALGSDPDAIAAASADGRLTLALNWGVIGTEEGYARALMVLRSDPELAAAWAAAIDPARPPGDVLAEYAKALPNGDPLLGVLAASPEMQARFFAAYGLDLRSAYNPAGLLVEVRPLADDEVIVCVAAAPLAGTAGAAVPLPSTVNAAAVDGLADSAILPAPPGVDPSQWRAALEALSGAPPAGVAALARDLVRLTDLTAAEIETIVGRDPAWLGAVFNTVRSTPPIEAFRAELALEIAGGAAPNYYALDYDANGNALVIDTSLVKLAGAQAGLAERYGVTDVPLTIRVPLWDGAPTDWSAPTAADLARLNAQIGRIGTVDFFMHGYQSDRGVWLPLMQDWMDASGAPAIGIAMAGMGSEGHYVGSGASQQTFLTNTGPVTSPYSPKQYGFSALEVMNTLGLFGREINVIGHSMGGAAALHLGLAVDALEADPAVAGEARMRYVLLAPAPSGDSVPFLRSGPSATLINLQNWAGTGVLEGVAALGNRLLGGAVIDHLLDQAPQWIKDIHTGFAAEAGFNQLRVTAHGLIRQPEPAPHAVAAWLDANAVYVVAGDDDAIVSTAAVQGVFGARRVRILAGDHYAHVESWAALEPEVRTFLAGAAR
jgi:hypothetical protein